MKYPTRYYFIGSAMIIITLLLTACGGNQLTYQVTGAADQAQVTYSNNDGNSQTETVTLPWETSFDVGGNAEFSLIADNMDGQGTISCAVLLNEKELGRADANYYASCQGSFRESGGSLSVNFSSSKDVLPDGSPAGLEATPTPTADDHLKQGLAYYEQGELDKALVEYKQAIKLDLDNPSAHRSLGTTYMDQGKWEEAVAAYERAIELAPDFGEAYGDMAAVYSKLNELEKAVAAGEKATELAPDYATAHNNLGAVYMRQDRLDEAVAEYQEAIRLDPDFASPHYNWGLVHYKQGQVEQAIAEWKEAARLDPNYPQTHRNLGVGYYELDQAAEALAEFEIYLQLAPDAPDRAAVESDIAKLNARLAALSEEAANPGPQSGKDMLITEAEANAFYVGTWKFDADTRNEGEFASNCRNFVDDSGEEIWYRTLTNCIFDPKPGASLDDIPSANILESAHSGQLDLLFYAFQPDSDHVAYDMYTVQGERVYFASIVHRNPMLGADNAPQQSDIDDFLYSVLTTNLAKSGTADVPPPYLAQ